MLLAVGFGSRDCDATGDDMNVQPLLDAINDRNIVSGLTHDIYRYPARFSPSFAKAAIELFTEAGDTILDPFMGGSTSLVEALALGRHAVGIDINQLAVFLARVKTLLLSDEELESLRAWAELTIPDLSPRKPVVRHTFYQELGYQTNMPWRFRKVAEQALNNAMDLLEGDLLLAARCVVLKTVQWAVDCKKLLPTATEFRAKITEDTEIVVEGLQALRQRVDSLRGRPATIEAHHCETDGIGKLKSSLLRRQAPEAGRHLAALPRRPRALPPVAGARPEGDRGPVLDHRVKRRPGGLVLHVLRPPPARPRRKVFRPAVTLLLGHP